MDVCLRPLLILQVEEKCLRDQRGPKSYSAQTRGSPIPCRRDQRAPAPIPPSPEGPQLSFRRDQRGPKSHSAEIRGFPTPIPQRPERARRHGFSWKLSSDPGTNKPDTARLWLFLEPFQFESVSNQVSCPLPARQRAAARAKGLSSRSVLSIGACYQVDMLGVRYKFVNFRAKNSLFDRMAWPKQTETELGFPRTLAYLVICDSGWVSLQHLLLSRHLSKIR